MTQGTITGQSLMGEVLEAYPSAQRALFRRYHIGGCNSCGYELGDTLEAVARGHNILDITEVLEFLDEAEQLDQRSQASPVEVAAFGQCDRYWRVRRTGSVDAETSENR